jgi:hypothetical protein
MSRYPEISNRRMWLIRIAGGVVGGLIVALLIAGFG